MASDTSMVHYTWWEQIPPEFPLFVDYMHYRENKEINNRIFPYRESNPSLLGESQVS